ncbi:hypothetical protein TthTF25_05750 [Thermus thermophilus]
MVDHGLQVEGLVQGREGEDEAEALGKGQGVLEGVPGLGGLPGQGVFPEAAHQVAAVGGGEEEDILGRALEAPLQEGLEVVEGLVLGVQGEVVQKEQVAVGQGGELLQKRPQAGQGPPFSTSTMRAPGRWRRLLAAVLFPVPRAP